MFPQKAMFSHHHDVDVTETGRRLGHDLFRYRTCWPSEPLSPSIREGLAQAAARGIRPEAPDRFVRKWLQLRLGAYQRGRAFDEAVTPGLIRSIDVPACPVLRLALTHGEQKDSDWSVDRLNNDGAYASTNLAVMSRRANAAKGSRSFDEVLALSERSVSTDGLLPIEWLRLAALMLGPCFAARPHAAPCLPLAAPIPLFSVRLAMQQVQHVFTTQAGTQAGKNRLVKHFRCASRDERSEARLRLLAEAVHQGLKGLAHAHDVWLDERVMAALQRWREALDDNAWALAGAISGRLANSRALAPSALASWRLATAGYVAERGHAMRVERKVQAMPCASTRHAAA
jgi:hypothetical protein